MTVRLDDSKLAKLKKIAAQRGTTLSEVIRQAVFSRRERLKRET